MSRGVLAVGLLSLAVAAGCEGTTEGRKSKEEAREAVTAAGDYVHAEYVAARQMEIAEVNKAIDELSASAERSSGQVKTDAQAKLMALRQEVARLGAELEKIKTAGESSWVEAKVGFEKSRDDVKENVRQARQWLSTEVAP